MKNTIFFIVAIIGFTSVFAQQEIEIIGVQYRATNTSNYFENSYLAKNNKLDAFINYGNDLGDKTKLFYHISYHTLNLNTSLNTENISFDDITYSEKIPNFYFMNFAAGMTNKFKKNWSLTNIVNYSYSDDNSKETFLKQHAYYKSFSYLKKKKSDQFSYGFGVYLSKLNDDLTVYPILSLQLKNKKRGLKLFFPRELKLWQKINDKSYIQLQTLLNSNYIQFTNATYGIEILDINTTLTYQYVFNKKIKFRAGVGIPFSKYDFEKDNRFTKTQQINYGFVAGLSYVVFKK